MQIWLVYCSTVYQKYPTVTSWVFCTETDIDVVLIYICVCVCVGITL